MEKLIKKNKKIQEICSKLVKGEILEHEAVLQLRVLGLKVKGFWENPKKEELFLIYKLLYTHQKKGEFIVTIGRGQKGGWHKKELFSIEGEFEDPPL